MSVVINPRTQRPVKVGSRTWRKLVSDGILNRTDEPNDDVQLYTLRRNDDPEEKIHELNASLPPTEQAVRGRGRYRGKIVRRRRQPSTERVALHTIQKTAEKIRDRDTYEDMHADGDFDGALEELIMQELSRTLPMNDRPSRPSYRVHENTEASEDTESSEVAEAVSASNEVEEVVEDVEDIEYDGESDESLVQFADQVDREDF